MSYSFFYGDYEQQDFSDDDVDWHDLDWTLMDDEDRERLLDEYNEEMALRLLLEDEALRDEWRREDMAGWATPEDEIPF